MDYKALGVQKLILIPTPGQTEQLYLVEHLSAVYASKVKIQTDEDIGTMYEFTFDDEDRTKNNKVSLTDMVNQLLLNSIL